MGVGSRLPRARGGGRIYRMSRVRGGGRIHRLPRMSGGHRLPRTRGGAGFPEC